jgi:hypothetical protein
VGRAGAVSAIVLLDVPRGTMRIDLARLRTQRKGPLEVCGVHGLPPGLHRVEVNDGDRPAVAWIQMEPGKMHIRAVDSGLLVDPDAFRTAQVQGLAVEDGIEPHLTAYPAAANGPWAALVAPLEALGRGAALPPLPVAPPQADLDAQFAKVHGGRPETTLAELAQAFIAGFIDEDEGAQERWKKLVAATYKVSPGLAKAEPKMMADAVELLMTQHQLLPAEMFEPASPLAAGARDFVKTLAAVGQADAAKRFAAHLDGRGVR